MPSTSEHGRAREFNEVEPPDEGELVRRAQAGDVDAFAALYRAHAGRVHALALRLTADRRQAEDLTQDVFVRAWQKLADFRGESALASWLHRLAVNAMLQASRGDRRRSARVMVSDDVEALERGSSHRGNADGPATRMDLERAIASLPPGARTAFVLHDVEGFRHDEIAARLGVAVGTVKAQLHRARKLLMERLDR